MEYNLTVVIPMYNRAHIIGRALESVFRQTLQDIEVIVVDDGSADNGVEVVRSYQENHPNLKLFEAEHGGPGLARNIGIQNAQGKYLAFLDSDDFVPERAYQRMFQMAEEGSCDFVVGLIARKIDTQNNGKWFVPVKIAEVIRSYEGKNCAQGFDIAIANPSLCNRMIRRDLILKHNLLFNGELFGEDMAYNLKLFRSAERASIIDEVVYCYETSYADACSTISSMTLEPVLSGLRSINSYALLFDGMGRIDWEIDVLLGPFAFVMQRFGMLSMQDKTVAFEEVKRYLGNFRGRKEYEIPITHLMGMELETLLTLPYPAYETCKKILEKASTPLLVTEKDPHASTSNKDPLMIVLNLYQQGQAGMRFILKYFTAWLKFKLKRNA